MFRKKDKQKSIALIKSDKKLSKKDLQKEIRKLKQEKELQALENLELLSQIFED